MRTLEATGKSIDEAIFNGLRELQISIDEVEIDIIQQETKGVFGIGAKPAIVRLCGAVLLSALSFCAGVKPLL